MAKLTETDLKEIRYRLLTKELKKNSLKCDKCKKLIKNGEEHVIIDISLYVTKTEGRTTDTKITAEKFERFHKRCVNKDIISSLTKFKNVK